jgi:hypothetical protein
LANEALDAETLAAFLDGRLDADARREVIERLAGSADALGILAEAAGVRAELEAGGAPATGAPARHAGGRYEGGRRGLPRWWWFALPAAAVLGAILLVRNIDRGGAPLALPDLVDGAALAGGTGDGVLAARFGGDWLDPGWSVARGAEPDGAARTFAFRLGVRIADYEIASGARDLSAVERVGGELERMLDGVQGGPPLAREYERLTGRVLEGADPASFAAERAAAADAARMLVADSPWWTLGVWIEQARLAALANEDTFFATAGAPVARLTTIAAAVEADPLADAAAVQAVRTLERSLAAGDAAPERLGNRIAAVMRTAGS